ncbi:hypothetical protein C5167_023797 [Papaver somniferum]|uniref:Uncharacterized protein n=1 Tax=Papaver somniferum TaxID=3469 RepID=A0A4Y7JLR7_PAPSO|nr:hypothetical protein C5167_023797 [Papaver somniferum]
MMTGIRYFNLTDPCIVALKRICVLKSSDSLFLTSTSLLFAAITSTSWHLMVTFCTLHVAQRFNVFKTKGIDTETVMLFGILNGVSTGLLDLCIGFNSIGFYQMTKLAIIPFTVLSETLFLNKVCDSELCGSVRHQIVYHFCKFVLIFEKTYHLYWC